MECQIAEHLKRRTLIERLAALSLILVVFSFWGTERAQMLSFLPQDESEGRVRFHLELEMSIRLDICVYGDGGGGCCLNDFLIYYRWLFVVASWKEQRNETSWALPRPSFIDEANAPSRDPNLPCGFGLRRSWWRRWTRPVFAARVALLSRQHAWQSIWAHQVQRSQCWLKRLQNNIDQK